jgi:hypothetical protein
VQSILIGQVDADQSSNLADKLRPKSARVNIEYENFHGQMHSTSYLYCRNERFFFFWSLKMGTTMPARALELSATYLKCNQ